MCQNKEKTENMAVYSYILKNIQGKKNKYGCAAGRKHVTIDTKCLWHSPWVTDAHFGAYNV